MSHGVVGGHGVVMSLELDPNGAPGVFTAIPNITSNIDQPKHDRPETNITPHDNTIDFWQLGTILRDPLACKATFDFDHAAHDHVTGIQKLHNSGVTFGVKLQGPNYPNGDSSGYYMSSGQMKTFQIMQPNLQGPRDLDFTIRLTGPEIIYTPARGAIRFGT